MWFLLHLYSVNNEQETIGLLLSNPSSMTGYFQLPREKFRFPSGWENEHPFSLKFKSLLGI